MRGGARQAAMRQEPASGTRARARVVVYEQPLNERVRTLLRLEMLFRRTRHSLARSTPWDSRAALEGLLEIMAITGRSDLRSEILKELERLAGVLGELASDPRVDQQRLARVLGEMEALVDVLRHGNGRFGDALKDNEFLAAVRQRVAIPGGTCGFDVPALQFWLEQPPELRRGDLEAWLAVFAPVETAAELILRLIRESAVPTRVVAEGGFFQRNLEGGRLCQMVRVGLPDGQGLYPEVSGGRHRVTVRFLEHDIRGGRPRQTARDVPFDFTCCTL